MLIKGLDPGGAQRDVRVTKDGDLLEGGIARTANPVAAANAVPVSATYDDLGRQVITPYQVRDLVSTGFATLALAAETAVISGVAGTLIDIVSITGANTSGAALRVDIRTGTGGSVVDSLVIPAASVASKTYHVPLPASEAAQAWTARVNNAGEISDSPVSITMVGIQNV